MSENKYDLTFGTDPEYFVAEMLDEKPYAVPVPHFIEILGIPEIGHDESGKHPVVYKCPDYKILMDGVAFEANPSPCKTAKEMYRKIQDVLSNIESIATKFGYSLFAKPTLFYDYWKWYRPESKMAAWCGEFGCDPDKDAILLEYQCPMIDVKNHPYRYGGGHLHITDQNRLIPDLPVPFIRILSMTVGNFSIVNSSEPELERLRAFCYGQPGRYRFPEEGYPDGSFGVEYRSPSNLWTTKLESIEGIMYWANKAYEYLNNQDRAIQVLDEFLDPTVEAIQTANQDLSSYILSKL